MEEVIKGWRNTFYTEFVLILALCATLFVLLRYPRKGKVDAILKVYVILFLALFLVDHLARFATLGKYLRPTVKILICLYYLVQIFETLAFAKIIRNSISKNPQRSIFTTSVLLLTVITVGEYFYLLKAPIQNHYLGLHYLSLTQAIIMLFGAGFYYYELLTRKEVDKRFQESDFWIITGISFYFLCTLPVSLLSPDLRTIDNNVYHDLYAFIYFFYIALFLMLIRAHLNAYRKS